MTFPNMEAIGLVPEVMYAKTRVQEQGLDPVAVTLPARLDPERPEGCKILGLPVLWVDSEIVGVVTSS